MVHNRIAIVYMLPCYRIPFDVYSYEVFRAIGADEGPGSFRVFSSA
jgi:hypothetical protein